MLAEAANDILGGLGGDTGEDRPPLAAVEDAEAPQAAQPSAPLIPGDIADEDEERLLLDTATWVSDQGLPDGELLFEVADEETGEPLVVLDLAWPDGLQPGLTPPVALLVDEPPETHTAAQAVDFQTFSQIERFRAYVRDEILTENAVV